MTIKEHVRRYMSWDTAPGEMTLVEAGQLMGKTPEALQKQAQRGQLPGAVKNGGQWRVIKEIYVAHMKAEAARNFRGVLLA